MKYKTLNLLVLHNGNYHPGSACGEIMRLLFERQGFARCTIGQQNELLKKPLEKYDAVILYCVAKELSTQTERNICRYVKNGGALIALHGAADCSKTNDRYLNMLGAEFVDHDPHVPQWHVNIADKSHPLVRNMEKFKITDEYYQIKLRDPKSRVFLTFPRRGKNLPLGFTREHGRGRVVYIGLGHSELAYRNPVFQRLLMRSVAYAANRIPEVPGTIGVGSVGWRIGGMCQFHTTCLSRIDGLKQVAICDKNSEVRQCGREQGYKVYSSHQKMLEDDNVDLVLILLPHNLHFREALRAIEAGKHVVVEKPLTLKISEADKLIEAASKKGVNLTCFQNRRWDPSFLMAKWIIQDNLGVGDILEIRLDFGLYGPPNAKWKGDMRMSGGNMWNMGSHGIDWILNLLQQPGPFQADPGPVVRVSGHALHWQWRMVTNEAHGKIVLRFAGGQTATFSDSRLRSGLPSEPLEIIGSEGSVVFPDVFGTEAHWTRVVDGRQLHTRVPYSGDEWAYANFYMQLVDRLLLGLPQEVTPQSAARVVGVIETAYNSAKAGRELVFEDKYFRDKN